MHRGSFHRLEAGVGVGVEVKCSREDKFVKNA